MNKKLKGLYQKLIKPILTFSIAFLLFKENDIEITPDYTELKTDKQDLNYPVEETTLDKIIITLEEQGFVLSEEALDAISSNFSLNDENEYTKVRELDDDFVINAYESIYNFEETNQHRYQYYDKETDEFDISNLTKKILINSKQEEIPNILDAFLEDEIYYILDNFINSFLPEYETKYNIDKSEIACNLANLAIMYDPYEEDSTAYVSEITYVCNKSFSKRLVLGFCDVNENIYELDLDNSTSLHEFFHLLCKSCGCNAILSDDLFFYPEGVGIGTISTSDTELTNDLNYKFIKEALAENNLRNFALMPKVYREENYVLDNIILALSLNPNFNIDDIASAEIEHQPIEFIRNFMVNSQDTQDSFVNNVEFLSIYNYLFSSFRNQELSALPSNYNLNDYYESLINYSQIELCKQFFNNLILYNEVNSFDEKLNAYYLNLFYQRLEKSQEILEIKNIGQKIDDDTVKKAFLTLLNNYIQYLKSYQIDTYYIESLNWVKSVDINLDDYNIASDKKNFYENIAIRELKLY